MLQWPDLLSVYTVSTRPGYYSSTFDIVLRLFLDKSSVDRYRNWLKIEPSISFKWLFDRLTCFKPRNDSIAFGISVNPIPDRFNTVSSVNTFIIDRINVLLRTLLYILEQLAGYLCDSYCGSITFHGLFSQLNLFNVGGSFWNVTKLLFPLPGYAPHCVG